MLLKKLLIIVLTVTSLSGCTPVKATPQKIKIGVVLYQSDDTFVGLVKENIAAYAREQENIDGIKITVNFVDGAGNQSLQNDAVDDFISQGYNAICMNMVDRTAAAVIIDKAMASDIPVVFFNREPVLEDMERWDKIFYVGAKAEQSGRMQGEIVGDAFLKDADRLDKNGDGVMQYIMLEGEPGHQDSLLRTDYSVSAILKAGIKVDKLANDSAIWQRVQGKEKMTGWLQTYGDAIEVLISNNDEMALGALDALKENGYNTPGSDKYIMVVGIDATPLALAAVADGSMYATIFNDSKAQAQAIFDIAYSMVTHGHAETSVEGFDGKYLWVDYTPVTADTVDNFR